jgi:hypothetical protein
MTVTPDNLGGAIALVENSGESIPSDSLIRIDGTTGSPTWRYDSAGYLSGYADKSLTIDQNGSIWVQESTFDGSSYSSALIQLNSSGSLSGVWSLPLSNAAYIDGGGCGGSSVTNGPPIASAITVDPSGTANFEMESSIQLQVTNCLQETVIGASDTSVLQLGTITAGGSLQLTPLVSSSASSGTYYISSPIPDGTGGVLASWSVQSGQSQFEDFGGNLNPAVVPVTSGTVAQTVLGDQNTYFTTDGVSIFAINETDGTQVWSWQPSQGLVEIVAATTGGGVTVRNVLSDGTENVVRLDYSGAPTYDTWGTTGSGYGVLSSATYTRGGVWAGQAQGHLAGIMGGVLSPAATIWSDPQGSPQKQRSADPALVLLATQDCHKSNSDKTLYARYPIYMLRQSTDLTKSPQQNYTVFEFIPNKSNCGVGGYNNLDPCQYADGSPQFPYDEFADEISVNIGGAAFSATQYFLYGLPNQRLYGVKQIYRTLADGSTQAKLPNAAFNQINASPGVDPLIDNQSDPWLAPWDGTTASCNSSYSVYFP